MICDVQDQERWDAFSLRHVRDGGKVAMLLRIIAELQAVPKLGIGMPCTRSRVSAVSMMAGTS